MTFIYPRLPRSFVLLLRGSGGEMKDTKYKSRHRRSQKFLRLLRVKNKKRWERITATQGEL